MKSSKRIARKPKRKQKISAWQRSTEFRLMASAAISHFNKNRHMHPKCGAIAKSTSEPCTQLAMANGRCYIHGGQTPRGDLWHLPVWPDKSAPRAMAKLNCKLIRRDREYLARKRKHAAMTPEERAAHDKWQKAHKPGNAGKRAATREEKRQLEAAKIALQGLRDKHFREQTTPTNVASENQVTSNIDDRTETVAVWPNHGVFE